MLETSYGLPERALRAVADLERRVVDHDGGRLKLEWGTLRARCVDTVQDLLWWQDGQLLGFLGLYGGPSAVELAGMVAPQARRRGIATALLDAALPLCVGRGRSQVLVVVPGGSAPGRCLALRRGAALEHSEYALALLGALEAGPEDPATTLRPALPADAGHVERLLAAAFGHPSAAWPDSDRDRTFVVEVAGAPVGTVRLTREGDDGAVYGFAVDPACQGRGIGRDVLGRVCRQLRSEGARRIGLEVAVDNRRALELYTSVGFTQLTTEDYYALPMP